MSEKYCEDCEYFRGSGDGNDCDLEGSENPHPSPDDGACDSFFPLDEDKDNGLDLICQLIDTVAKHESPMNHLVATHYYIKGSIPPGSNATAYTIVARDWKDGKVTRWALTRGPFRYNKDAGKFEVEPGSGRIEAEYIASHSFDTLQDAYDAYVAYRKAHPEKFDDSDA